MLIQRPFINEKDQYKLDLQRLKIKHAVRKLLIFVDKTEFEAGMAQFGKCIQINMAVEDGAGYKMSLFSLSDLNTVSLKETVYIYNAFFPIPSDFRSGILTLQNAFAVDETNKFDTKESFKSNIGIYNDKISTTEGKLDIINQSGMLYETAFILPPKYYTEKHEESERGDAYSIVWEDTKITVEIVELLDPFTIVEYHDIKTWDTMIPMLKNEIMLKSSDKRDTNPVNFVTNLFVPASEAMMYGYSFIYDSFLGINVKSIPGMTQIPMQEFRFKENLIQNLNFLKDIVLAEAKCIEEMKGNIRLYYTPLATGDRVKIIYLDYEKKNQPDFNNTKIDKGYSVEEGAVELINTAYNFLKDDGESI